MNDSLTMRVLGSQVDLELIDECFERFDFAKSSDVVHKPGALLRVNYESAEGKVAGGSHDGHR